MHFTQKQKKRVGRNNGLTTDARLFQQGIPFVDYRGMCQLLRRRIRSATLFFLIRILFNGELLVPREWLKFLSSYAEHRVHDCNYKDVAWS